MTKQTQAKPTAENERIFESALAGVKYKYGRPLKATRENLRKVEAGEL